MPSIIEGYTYDIFISYRQKDNKGDKWVSRFAEALKTELESTFKEDVSVYFDTNPGDYLLETYDVDASLKDKLKCLVFIPIISRTYCDPKSFAWEHEFKAFVDQASNDQFGLKIKLPNGNVASRVLPVRIHDLDAADIKECESVLGGVLRGIDFIYKEAGIDKPLAPDDDEKRNLNNTKYLIQIIKIAHSAKEIILGMKNESACVVKEKELVGGSVRDAKTGEIKEVKGRPTKEHKINFLSVIAIVVLLLIAGIIAYSKIYKRDSFGRLRSSGGRITVVVVPFQNLTNDTIWNIWQEGIQINLISALTNTEGLRVRQPELTNNFVHRNGVRNFAALTPDIVHAISQKLEAELFIIGNILKSGNVIRLNAQLFDSGTGEAVKSFQAEGVPSEDDILKKIDSLSIMINNYLILTKIQKGSGQLKSYSTLPTNSPEAYRCYILGKKALSNADPVNAIQKFYEAVKLDSNLYAAYAGITLALYNLSNFPLAKAWMKKYYSYREKLDFKERIGADYFNSLLNGTPDERIRYIAQLQYVDDQDPDLYVALGFNYAEMFKYDKAILNLEKALKVFNKWDSIPIVYFYYALGSVYQKTGQFKKADKLYKKTQKLFPDDYFLIGMYASLEFSKRDTIEGNTWLEAYRLKAREHSLSEAQIEKDIGDAFKDAGFPEKAEKHYRKALSLEPDNNFWMETLAYFLVINNRNDEEGLELAEKLIDLQPKNFIALQIKGIVLLHRGNYAEALNLLSRSWDIRLQFARYDHEAFLQLEAAKKAVAGQNN